MKRILSALLLTTMLASVSCGSSSTSSDTTAAPSGETTPAETADPLMPSSTKDWGEREFTIITSTANKFVFSEEQNGSLVGDALYERDLMTEEELNCDITYKTYPTINEIFPAVNASVMAGDSDFDLIVSHVNWELTNYVTENIVLDWNSVPNVDLSKPYWNQSIIEMLTVNGKSPYASSDLYMPDTVFLLYNKELAEDLQLGSLYDYVYDGTWTWDKLIEISSSVTADINGDTQMTEDDRYGVAIDISGSRWLLRNIPSTCGQLIYENGKDGLKFTYNTEKTVSILEKACALFNGGGGFLRNGDKIDDSGAAALFDQGSYLTWFVSMSNAASVYNNLSFDYGVLPLPKYDESQEDYLTLAWNHNLMIPTTADPDFSGMVTEWMSYYGNKLVRPKFYDSLLSVRFAQDAQTVEILDIIYDGIIYDPGMSFKSKGFYDIFDYLVCNNMSDFASFYSQRISAEEAYIAQLNESFADFGG